MFDWIFSSTTRTKQIPLSPSLYTTHLYFLGIRTYSMFTLSYKKILQVYCLDSVSSGIPIHYSCTVCISSTGSFLLYYLVRNGIHDNTRTYIQFLFLTFVSILKCAQLKRSRPIIITAFVCLALNLQLGPPIVLGTTYMRNTSSRKITEVKQH